jgi:predicted dehydrogenase
MVGITRRIQNHPDLDIVAVVEAEPHACAEYLSAAGVQVTYHSLDDVLDSLDFDILALGDVYARRGAQVIKGLEAGKHIISDKPLCTRVEEADRIEELAQARNLSVFVWLSLRYEAAWQTARRLIRTGEIGEIGTAYATGPHSLAYKAGRPDWYFEPGQHGGIINDLMIHAIDALPWLTGKRLVEVIAARAWNARLPEAPFFQDASQVMLRLENGAGVTVDCSYKTVPGHSHPWVFDFWGTKGRLLLDGAKGITLQLPHQPERRVEGTVDVETDPLEEMLAEMRGNLPSAPILTTRECLRSTRQALLVQQAADQGQTCVRI